MKKSRPSSALVAPVHTASVPLLKQPDLSLVLTKGSALQGRPMVLAWIESATTRRAAVFVEVAREHCCAMVDEFDASTWQVVLGHAIFRVDAHYAAAVRRALG